VRFHFDFRRKLFKIVRNKRLSSQETRNTWRQNSLTKLYAQASLVGDFRIDVDDQRAHTVALDLVPPDGKDMGPSALDLCLMSFVGCYAAIFMLTVQKMRVKVKNLGVKAVAVKSEQAGTITGAEVDVVVDSDAREDRLKRAHELTVKGCPVGLLFERAKVKIAYHLSLVSPKKD
jgi:putative redox protein